MTGPVAVIGDGAVAEALRRLLRHDGVRVAARDDDAEVRALFLGTAALPSGTAAELFVEAFDRALAEGVDAPARILSGALPRLARAGGGSVVLEVGPGAVSAAPAAAAEGAVSAARVGLARTAALEYGRDGVRVNALLVAGLEPSGGSVLPRRRAVTPDEAARAARALLDAAFSGVSGAVLAVDAAMGAVASLPVQVADAAS